jgi:hypothetical protein
MSNPHVEQIWSAEVDGGDGLLATVIYSAFSAPGVTFFTDDHAPQQVANINHPEGYVVPPHVHNPRVRQVSRTDEVLIIRIGVVAVDFYTSQGVLVCTRELLRGDVCVLQGGGHGLRMITGAEFWEVKQGPYAGKEQDKRML